MLGGKSKFQAHSPNLEKIVDDEVFDSKKEKNLYRKGQEWIMHNAYKTGIALSGIAGLSAWYLSSKVLSSYSFLLEKLKDGTIDPSYITKNSIITGLFAAGLTWSFSAPIINNKIGKRISGLKEVKKKIKMKKENFVSRFKPWITAGIGIGASLLAYKKIINLYGPFNPEQNQFLMENMDKVAISAAGLATMIFGGIYAGIYFTGKLLDFNSKDYWKYFPGYLLHLVNKETGIEYLERQAGKGNIFANEFLSQKKTDFNQKLEHTQRVVESFEKDKIKYGDRANWIKFGLIGEEYSNLIKNQDPNTLIELAMKIDPINHERAMIFLNKLSKKDHIVNGVNVIALRNLYLHRIGRDSPEHWIELEERAKQEKVLESHKSTEGEVWAFPEEIYANKMFMFKTYPKQKLLKFLIEKGIFDITQSSSVKTEEPIVFYNQGVRQTHVMVREGRQNVRQRAKNLDSNEKMDLFEGGLRALNEYQKTLFPAVTYIDNDHYILQVEHNGTTHDLQIPIHEPDKKLIQRAFRGYNNEKRLGVNNHLLPLIIKRSQFRNQNSTNTINDLLTFNHGDPYGTNMMVIDKPNEETIYVSIDPKPNISHPVDGLSYFSLEPSFLELDFCDRKEEAVEILLTNDGINGNQGNLERDFDMFYLDNSLGLLGSQFYHGEALNTEMLMHDLRRFADGKCFEKELKAYLLESNARDIATKVY